VDAPPVPLRRQGPRALVLQAPAVRRGRSLRLALLQEADVEVVVVGALPPLLPDSFPRLNSVAAPCLHSAPESGAVPGD
jgi:hypothetical protein